MNIFVVSLKHFSAEICLPNAYSVVANKKAMTRKSQWKVSYFDIVTGNSCNIYMYIYMI